MNTFWRRTAGALSLALMLLAPPAGAAGPGGRYFLQDVMETGSELRLHDDGRFEWSLAYGALDRLQRGQWSREGERVVLVADAPAAGPSLLRVDAMFPWDADTETRLRDMEIDRDGALAQERCPFLAVADATSALPLPALAEPSIPDACGAPSAADAEAIAAAQPGQGLGVVVGDPDAGLRFSGIDVTFLFSDGHRDTRTTNRGGWALLRPRPGARWQRVTLHRDGDDAVPELQSAFAVDTGKGDVLAIALDSARLAPPLFERMTLRIEGEALVPTWPDGQERGTYVRE